MKWAAVAASLAMLGTLPAGAQQATGVAGAQPLLGTWESVVRSRGGIGRAFILAADGSAINAQVAMPPDARYVYDGTRLRVVEEDGSTTSDELAISGDSMRWGPGGSARTFVRVPSGSGGEGIVGRWTAAGDGAAGYLVFTPDGTMHARGILQTMLGRHATDGDHVTLTFADRPIRFRYAFVGDTLVLTPRGGRAERYVRGR